MRTLEQVVNRRLKAGVRQASPLAHANKIHAGKGGKTTAMRHSEEVRGAWGSKGGNSTLRRYGREFYSHIQRLGVQSRRARKAAQAQAA